MKQLKRRRYSQARQKKNLPEPVKSEVHVKVHIKDLKNLIERLQQVSESEKSKLAHELHDELGSTLTASRMDIAWVRQHLIGQQPALADKLSRALLHLDQGINLKRRIIEDLRPSTLTTLGFTVAAQDLADQMGAQSGWNLELQFPEKPPVLRQDVTIALFRILQESLMNIVKHARASAVRISLVYGADKVKLEVEDNGIGFRKNSMNNKVLGLLGMRQRAVTFGGRIEIKSRQRRGTLVSALIYLGKRS